MATKKTLLLHLIIVLSSICIKGSGAIPLRDTIVYQSENLEIHRLSEHVYQHISYLKTEDYGKVACNGMIIVNKNEAVVFDTPAGLLSSEELIAFVSGNLRSKIKAVIPTHFHEDCVAGLDKFGEHGIPGYASTKTLSFLDKTERKFLYPLKTFANQLTINIGGKKAHVRYFGEGHTKDNVTGYFPADNALFGGCLIKEVGATKGYLGDANVQSWPDTVKKLKQKYPKLGIIIPGHGEPGGTELLDYTIALFKQ